MRRLLLLLSWQGLASCAGQGSLHVRIQGFTGATHLQCQRLCTLAGTPNDGHHGILMLIWSLHVPA